MTSCQAPDQSAHKIHFHYCTFLTSINNARQFFCGGRANHGRRAFLIISPNMCYNTDIFEIKG
ncbi:hypothetical protein GLN3_11680 [Geobacillus lituanicus]|nr:hypothetical protein GLN3_11680 [Geobacillus lituanicus]